MENFSISINKDLVDVDLLLQDQLSLPEAMRQLNLCEAFVGVLSGRTVAVCLLAKRKNYYDIVNLAVAALPEDTGVIYELLMYVMDYVRVQGGRFVEIGMGNAELRRHALLIRLGFRVVGVWGDYFARGGETAQPGKVVNRDLLRYRIDLNELQPRYRQSTF